RRIDTSSRDIARGAAKAASIGRDEQTAAAGDKVEQGGLFRGTQRADGCRRVKLSTQNETVDGGKITGSQNTCRRERDIWPIGRNQSALRGLQRRVGNAVETAAR